MMNQSIEPTRLTWILVIFGAITLLPLVVAQLSILMRPDSQHTKNILIGKGEDWRDRTHFRSAYGFAWADWVLLVPLGVAGSIGVLLGRPWGYVLWAAAGTLSLYVNVVLWFLEKEYVYPSRGPLAYYTYYWGFYVLWGAAALGYSALRLSGVSI
jgi:hypothetical protein